MNPAEFIPRYEQALASQDWKIVAPLIHSNRSVTFSTGQIHRGRAAVEEGFHSIFDLIKDEGCAMSNLHRVLK
jgi:hypothetical protein